MRWTPEELAEMTEHDLHFLMDELNYEAELVGCTTAENQAAYDSLTAEIDSRLAGRMIR